MSSLPCDIYSRPPPQTLPQTKSWTDSSYQDGFTPTLILRNTQLLNRLRDTGALKNLSIQFASQYTADGFGSDKLWTQFHGFHNLTSLELYHFYCEEDKLVKEISRILCHNPRLQKLGLGIAHDADCDGNPEMIITNDNYDFLEKLCERYASRQGTVPLSLHTLRLGHGMFLNHKKSGTTENWLKKLVKLDEIRTLHIFNSILLDMEEDEPAETVIDWSLFEDCKSIRQLSVSRISSDVIEWLRGGGKTVEELLIADHYDMYDNEGMDRFNILNLPHLSMLYVREIWVDKRTEDDDWDDTDSDASDPEEVEEADTMDLDASELESPRMDPSVMTVLDRLPDGGVHLTRLALCITFEDQWTLFATHLPKLKHLTYLRLDSKSAHGGRFPPMQASIWSGINRYIEIAMRYVQLARYLCSSLQFARVGEWAWQITVPLGVDLADAGSDIYDLIKLRRLDFDEMMSIELFSIHTFTCQSGLLGKETWHEEMSEEESHRMDLQMEEIDAAMREGRPVRRLFTSIGEGPDIHIPDFL
ncbi:uncharacterized protein PAC_05478 [Phialocephala subalpina]|uniref:F-box domain protein n=1 Tax=Phialocephala subalpina TaxID=576137 RepID=A0A1L7WS41_9HELO|nr:uncharacterized protein PAC_05478 [Phialocephala subalpina]